MLDFNLTQGYNYTVFTVFSFIALILQTPLLFIYSRGPRPNVPVTIIAAWFFYLNLRNFLGGLLWKDSDVFHWFSGNAYCDIDTRLYTSAQSGILLAQVAIDINLLRIFQSKPATISTRTTRRRMVQELVMCLTLPVVQFVIYTFVSVVRFGVGEGIGCIPTTDQSWVWLLFFQLWAPVLGVLSMILLTIMFFRIWQRGKTAALEAVSYMPKMRPEHFVRIVIFSVVVTLVITPLCVFVLYVNYRGGHASVLREVAWAHGKPPYWNAVQGLPLDNDKILAICDYDQEAASVTISNLSSLILVNILNCLLSYIMFFLYGTGDTAISFYKEVACILRLDKLVYKLHIVPRPEKREAEPKFEEPLSGKSTSKGFESTSYAVDGFETSSEFSFEEPQVPVAATRVLMGTRRINPLPIRGD